MNTESPSFAAKPVTIATLRNSFISGLLLLAPVAATVWVVNLLLNSIGGPARDLFFFFLPAETLDHHLVAYGLSILSILLVGILITILGWFSRYLIGRLIVQGLERLLQTVPFVRTVYNTVKQIVQTFSQQQKAVFQEVVMIEFPRKGVYALGFLTSRAGGEVQFRTHAEVLNVFIPTTPNPTSGYLCMIPRQDVTSLDMSVTDGMKLIISGGAVVPPWSERSERSDRSDLSDPSDPSDLPKGLGCGAPAAGLQALGQALAEGTGVHAQAGSHRRDRCQKRIGRRLVIVIEHDQAGRRVDSAAGQKRGHDVVR